MKKFFFIAKKKERLCLNHKENINLGSISNDKLFDTLVQFLVQFFSSVF